MSYKCLVRPQLEYCRTIWDLHNKCNINQLESIQNRAARFILSDKMQNNLVDLNLQLRRLFISQEDSCKASAAQQPTNAPAYLMQ